MNYSNDELVDMVYLLGECQRNCLLAARLYRERYPERRHPQQQCFERVKTRFERTANANYEKTQRTHEVSSENNQFNVIAAVVENPHVSVRQISHEFTISKSLINKILIKHKFHPYHIQLQQHLNENDFEFRLNFCNWAHEKYNDDQNFFNYVLFSDEASFSSTGHVNRHNFHFYANENPNFIRRIDRQHRFSINVWGGIVGDNVIGPYFFDGSLNGDKYLEFLRHQLQDLLEDVPLDVVRRLWFMHDGAPPHYSERVRQFLNENYGIRWIGRGGPVLWPPRSPDLNPMDYFLWGYTKNLVYEIMPTSKNDLKEKIRNAFRSITPQVLRTVRASFCKRVDACIQENGHHFEHLL